MAAPAAGAVTFAPAPGSPFAAGHLPWAIAVGDFNEDGDLDTLVANEDSQNVSVLLGDGAGGLSPALMPTVGTGHVQSVAVGDVNGDDDLDFVAANRDESTVSVELGDGAGNFTPALGSPVSLGAFRGPVSVALSDLDGDHDLDFATANAAHNVTVMLGNGTGVFTEAAGSPVAVGQIPTSVAIADFTGDHAPDLAVGNLGNSSGNGGLTLLFNNGSAGFPTSRFFAFVGGTVSVAAGDLNGDGDGDVALARLFDSSIGVMLGDGTGDLTAVAGSPFTTRPAVGDHVGSGPNSVAIGDVNGDGKPDLATANTWGDVSVLVGSGSGSFAVTSDTPYPAGDTTYAVALGDFNGDAALDIVAANQDSDDVTLLLSASPDTSITSGPRDPTRSTSATFEFGSSDLPSAFECKLDGADWQGCSSPAVYSDVPAGTHTFQVRAINDVGKVDPTPATQTWTIDHTTPPVAALDASPNPVLTGEEVTFDASASHDSLDGVATDYRWDLDGDGTYELHTFGTPTATRSYAARRIVHAHVLVTGDAGTSASAGVEVDVRRAPPPGDLGVSIDGGARYTNHRHVSVSAVWPALAVSLRISNDGGFGDAETFPVAQRVPWTLASSAPERLPQTIYVRFSGGGSGPETYQDDIILDRSRPVVEAARIAAKASRYSIRLRARDRVSGLKTVQVAGRVLHPGRQFSYRTTVRVRSAAPPRWVRVRDRAGNWSHWRRLSR
jgi:hypothetical protein